MRMLVQNGIQIRCESLVGVSRMEPLSPILCGDSRGRKDEWLRSLFVPWAMGMGQTAGIAISLSIAAL
jgi:hypothetical protein